MVRIYIMSHARQRSAISRCKTRVRLPPAAAVPRPRPFDSPENKYRHPPPPRQNKKRSEDINKISRAPHNFLQGRVRVSRGTTEKSTTKKAGGRVRTRRRGIADDAYVRGGALSRLDRNRTNQLRTIAPNPVITRLHRVA